MMASNLKRRYVNYKMKGAFRGVEGYRKDAKSGLVASTVKKNLQKIPAYTLHVPVTKHYKRRRVYVHGINEQWGMDLADIQKYSGSNNRKKYLLCVMDIFSKRAWVEAIPNKTGPVVLKALQKIFTRAGAMPLKIQSDKGSEFLNRQVATFLKANKIKLFSVYSGLKCCTIERFIRTFMGKVARYMTHNKTKRFVDKLQDLENLYNNSYHRSIKMTPFEVNKSNEHQVFQNLYGGKEHVAYKAPKFRIGDKVTLSKQKTIFEKGYMPGWQGVYKIKTIRETIPRTFELETLDKIQVQGAFYTEQLQKINHG